MEHRDKDYLNRLWGQIFKECVSFPEFQNGLQILDEIPFVGGKIPKEPYFPSKYPLRMS